MFDLFIFNWFIKFVYLILFLIWIRRAVRLGGLRFGAARPSLTHTKASDWKHHLCKQLTQIIQWQNHRSRRPGEHMKSITWSRPYRRPDSRRRRWTRYARRSSPSWSKCLCLFSSFCWCSAERFGKVNERSVSELSLIELIFGLSPVNRVRLNDAVRYSPFVLSISHCRARSNWMKFSSDRPYRAAHRDRGTGPPGTPNRTAPRRRPTVCWPDRFGTFRSPPCSAAWIRPGLCSPICWPNRRRMCPSPISGLTPRRAALRTSEWNGLVSHNC